MQLRDEEYQLIGNTTLFIIVFVLDFFIKNKIISIILLFVMLFQAYCAYDQVKRLIKARKEDK